MAIRTAWNDFARRPRKDVICINNTVWATGSTFVQLKNRPVQIYICPRCKCERGQRIDTARRDDATTLSCRWDECLSLLSHIERNYGREIWYLPSFFISIIRVLNLATRPSKVGWSGYSAWKLINNGIFNTVDRRILDRAMEIYVV